MTQEQAVAHAESLRQYREECILITIRQLYPNLIDTNVLLSYDAINVDSLIRTLEHLREVKQFKQQLVILSGDGTAMREAV